MNWIEQNTLYHVSETPDIECFSPRPANDGREKVWAIQGKRLQNYLFPRDCPRICIWANSATTAQDQILLNGAKTHITIEERWRDICAQTTLYIYEFAPDQFELEDQNAGYMTSQAETAAIKMHKLAWGEIDFAQLDTRLSFAKNLPPWRDKVLGTSLAYSMIRMRNAQPTQSTPI